MLLYFSRAALRYYDADARPFDAVMAIDYHCAVLRLRFFIALILIRCRHTLMLCLLSPLRLPHYAAFMINRRFSPPWLFRHYTTRRRRHTLIAAITLITMAPLYAVIR